MNERNELISAFEDFFLACTSKDHSILTEALNELLHICEEDERERIETLIELIDDYTQTDLYLKT